MPNSVSSVRRTLFAGLGVAFVGCTTLAGIDDEYVAANPIQNAGRSGASGAAGEDAASGRGGSDGIGGSSGVTGGGTGSGGAGGSAGTGAAAGSSGDASAACPTGQKFCNGECTDVRPLVGCDPRNCAPCTETPPENSHAVCKGTACAFDCDTNFQPDAGRCVPVGSGGTAGGGGGGSGGTAGSVGTGGSAGTSGTGGGPCVPTQCPGCFPQGPFGCCLRSGGCGCTWAPTAVCYPG